MKRIIGILLLILTVAAMALPLTSCGEEDPVAGAIKYTDGESFIGGYNDFSGYALDLKSYKEISDLEQALTDGDVDFIVLDKESAEALAEKNGKLQLIPHALPDTEGHVILTLESATLFDGCGSTQDVLAVLEEVQKSDLEVEWDLFYNKFITYKGYEVALEGLGVTMYIAVMGLLIGIVIGTLIALIKMIPKYHIAPRILSVICDVYVGFFRGTPMVVQLLIAWFILIPAIGVNMNNTLVAALVFGMNSGAYVSEIMRSGIQAVDVGQLEAARALGLGYWTSMMKIVIPQGIKNILPTLGNEFIVLVKDTSIVSFIAVVDVTKAFRQIGDANYSYIIPYLMLALVYLVIVIAITLLIKLMERRLARSERRK